MTWIVPPASQTSKAGCGAVAGLRATDPSASRNVLPCQGQVRQPDQPGHPLPGGDHRIENGGLLQTVYQQHAGARCRPAAR